MQSIILTGLFFPLIGFLFLLATSKSIGRRLAGLIGCSTIFISFLCFFILLFEYTLAAMHPIHFSLFKFFSFDQINTEFSLTLDPLSLLMALIITGIGFLIHLYSIGYMEHDEDLPRYFACMNFFIFAMLLLVLAGDLFLLFIGWEGVGLASYLLIGFWYQRPSAARAATKAFIVNRIGDLGLLLGLILTFYTFGTGNIEAITQRVQQEFMIGAPILTLLSFLYFWGATGKSAQLPLYVWLPDAMEGPTPVSALIHAATMVTAGVYLVVRMHTLFMFAPMTMHLVGYVGGITALFASLCAIGQTDLKRVLAYSTISQLGLMFLACGIGAFYAAMFHLTTHAFMKALLFLAAGNVIHMLGGTTDMAEMGGLRKVFPRTHWLFLIGVLAMSGLPPMAAFFSKDLILEQEHLAGFEILFYIGLITSVLTAFYLTRAYYLTFIGPHQPDAKTIEVTQEAPSIMLFPVTTLAVLSIFGGLLGFTFGRTPLLEGFLAKVGVTLAEEEPTTSLLLRPETWMSIAAALLGISTAIYMYRRWTDQLVHPFTVLKKAFYINEIYWALIGRPLKALARFIADIVEPKLFDGFIHLIVRTTRKISYEMQQLQSGQIRSYFAWMVIGTVLMMIYFVL